MTVFKLRNLSGRLLIVLSIVGALSVQGCLGGGAKPDERPVRTKVSGTVTYNGTPLADAIVSFHPTVAKKTGSNGRTDAEGKFEMGTFEATDGTLPGKYNVTITKNESASGATQPSPDDPNYDPNPPAEAEPKSLIPKKYGDPVKSGLTVTVEDGKEITDLKFELKD